MSFQVIAVNVQGLGGKTRSKLNNKTKTVSYKIKELISSTRYIPTFYILSETKRKCNFARLNLPNHVHYIGETSSGTSPSGGLYLFSDNIFTIEDKKTDVIVISPCHAIFAKLKVFDKSYEFICVYLPSDTKHCLKVLQDIDNFITKRKLKQFTLIGDTNISFSNPSHKIKALTLSKITRRCNLYNLATHLNCNVDYSWRGRGARINSMSLIDHCFTNVSEFSKIDYKFHSFSDHKSLCIGTSKKFKYSAPKWKKFLFNNKDFQDLMKKESISFIFDNADLFSKNKNMEFYLNNPNLAEIDLSFTNNFYQETSVLFVLLKHLKLHHDKFYSNFRLKSYLKTKEFDDSISQILDNLNVSTINRTDEIDILYKQQQQYFINLTQFRSETVYMRNLLLDGKPNAYTFSHCSRKYNQKHCLMINDLLNHDPQEIANYLSKLHAKTVSPEIIPNYDLDSFLQNYNINIEQIYPKIHNLTSPICTTKEYKDVIKSMSNNSSPGISSEPKILFQYLFEFLPNFMTKALNQLHLVKNIDNSPFAWIKDRNIVFIDKKGSDPTLGQNKRPISSMETIYKIQSKSLNKKVLPHLSKIISNDQFGFTPKRHMHSASLSIIATMNHIKSHNLDSQLISFDIQRAFDRIIPKVLHRILKHIFPNGIFAQTWINLTSKGRFRAKVENCYSEFIDIILGTPQGGPSASTLFNILHHIFPSVLDSVVFHHISLKINNKILKSSAFADDTWKFYCLKVIGDIEKLHSMLIDLEKSTGLKINFSKTKILTYGNIPPALNIIGLIQSSLKHLGIHLSFDFKKAAQITYDELLYNLNKKAKALPLRNSYNIFKRRNLCMSLLNSMCFHIFRVYCPNNEQIKKLWKIISKFLWSNKNLDGISYRFKVSEKRIELDFVNGGLKFLKPENQSLSIFIPSLLNTIHHAFSYPNSTLGIIFHHKHLDLKKLLSNFGYSTFLKNKKSIKSIYPSCNDRYFNQIISFLKDLELNNDTCLKIPLISSSILYQRLSSNEINLLKTNNIITAANILDHRIIGERVLILPSLHPKLINNPACNSLVEKLNDLKHIASHFPVFSKNEFKKLSKPLIDLNNFNPTIFSLHFKIMLRNKSEKQPPAIKTRLRDGLFFPDNETFELSFSKLFSLPLPLYFKSFYFEQISRTLVSKRKLCHFGHSDTTKCILCNVDSSLEHALFSCLFPKYFINALALYLDSIFNHDIPEFIHLKENFYLFNTWYPVFANNEIYFQLSLLILFSKDRSLKISKDDCLSRWTILNCFSQSLFVAKSTITILNNMGVKNDFINDFLEFLLKQKNNISYFKCR